MWREDDCFIHGCVFYYWMCQSDVSVISFRMCCFVCYHRVIYYDEPMTNVKRGAMWRVDDCLIHGYVFCHWICRSDVSVIPFRMCLFFSHSF